ncbi:M24 family metallopeptidase [Amycolatopsis thermophila]|uniref:Xaa-Pro aminopeptidase n=1 Tax=Amycolatopsis thermophila TaxID=206084 RepID=A0ABU0EZN5_9PSEU|nr:Xaa-Pro peptidase family protein [Amycolatopsis thermophila]MDQ0380772.1 Xaa-Pro aminopeptidase [Amycolatopsis thermophila]
MPDLHASRRDALRTVLNESGVDALLVTDLLNVRYLTGFTGSNAVLLVHREGEARTVFCTDGRYTTQAAAEVPDLERVIERESAAALLARAAEEAAAHRRTGFESQHVSVEAYDGFTRIAEGIELTRAPGLVERLRLVKDETEIEALRMACAAADRALAGLLEHGGIRPGRTEREVARDLEDRMLDHGSSGPSFDSIVAAGPHSAIPHHRPTDRVLRTGDFVKLDFGATIDGYHSDMTRTVVLGRPAAWQEDLYELVRRAQETGLEASLAGQEVADVDLAARRVIEHGGHGEEFSHGLGHGVGLEVHEAPRLAENGAGTLAVGMTVTVEPGVYLAGRGGVRIEDTLVVRDADPELLTLSSKELVVV